MSTPRCICPKPFSPRLIRRGCPVHTRTMHVHTPSGPPDLGSALLGAITALPLEKPDTEPPPHFSDPSPFESGGGDFGGAGASGDFGDSPSDCSSGGNCSCGED